MSILAATGTMVLKDPGREASGVTATRLSAREASCSVLLLECDFKVVIAGFVRSSKEL